MEPLLILTTVPDQDTAEKLAHALIEGHAAACVNVLAACRSIYRWQGAVEAVDEIPLLIKTTAANYARVEVIVRALHPYDVPELIATPITHGLPAYLDWLVKETEKHD
ncbi:MAG: divalent-cation tolerance protein CutA [Thiobacillus sp.]|jgi:periplasmic divalent cation tolerance protein|uniref:divalent-cation tolerance protein CutA n=1 Tax=Thiobacillus sp. TaxID=924 RepID=UPI002894F933|nr:divalent-cation tolerance protein CutA [Thiobacillus sp.]MDT3705844.1 divalent-cation tolerance protein CutA [Thiobacillus sp.]